MKSFLKDVYYIVRPGGLLKAIFFIVILGELTSTYAYPTSLILGLAWILFCVGGLFLQTWLYRIFTTRQNLKRTTSKPTASS